MYVLAFVVILFSQNLFSQIVVTGVVQDNSNAPVEGALVELVDQADAARVFNNITNAQGEYSIQITTTGIGDVIAQQPGSFNLLQNFPNPFNPSTVISYEIPHPAHLRIEIYNVLGQKIKTLFDGFQASLYGRVVWDGINEKGQGVSAGVYIYSLITDNARLNRKMLLLDGHSGITSATGQFVTTSAIDWQTGLYKTTTNLYLLRVSGVNIETYTQTDLQITASTNLYVNVFRTVTDIDGNVYRIVKIGDQWWMAEDLRVTHYRNGDAIPKVIDYSAWGALSTGAYWYYDNASSYAATYGALYNWYVVTDSRNLAPAGWHVPTDAEWKQLEMYLGMSQSDADDYGRRGTNEGGKLKETGTIHWDSPNEGATNSSGFCARPGGHREKNYGHFRDMGGYAYYWSATEYYSDSAWYRILSYYRSGVSRNYVGKHYGFSVRCIRD